MQYNDNNNNNNTKTNNNDSDDKIKRNSENIETTKLVTIQTDKTNCLIPKS